MAPSTASANINATPPTSHVPSVPINDRVTGRHGRAHTRSPARPRSPGEGRGWSQPLQFTTCDRPVLLDTPTAVTPQLGGQLRPQPTAQLLTEVACRHCRHGRLEGPRQIGFALVTRVASASRLRLDEPSPTLQHQSRERREADHDRRGTRSQRLDPYRILDERFDRGLGANMKRPVPPEAGHQPMSRP